LALHDITNKHQRLAIEVHAVDNNIVKVLKLVTMPNSLTLEFLSVVQEQLTTVADNFVMEKWMNPPIGELILKIEIKKMGT
jgi:rRNA pseudouridine-1189 N-methylase Emg1 (Nep1/Mra1 family)